MFNSNNETITRDPIFGHVFSKEENCLYLLQQILPELNIQNIEVTPQKEVNKRLDEHNARFDIWAKDDQGRTYDIELQLRQEHNLGTRFRYYQSETDKDTLKPGETYLQIRESYIIFLCPFDQFGKDKVIYRGCYLGDETDLSTKLNTKAHWITINSHGHHGEITEGLREFLDYMNGKMDEESPFIRKIDSEVKDYIASPEWRKIDMNLDVMLADQQIDDEIEAIKNMVEFNRSNNISDSNTLKFVEQKYGDHFSKEELEKIVKSVK